MLTLIAMLQYATAATFVAIGLAAHRHGSAAQHAAETEVRRQGFPADVLTRQRVRIEESLAELMFPLGIAVMLSLLATLNVTASGIGRTATWIVQPPFLIAAGFITAGQVFATRFTAAMFRKSADPEARKVDVGKVLDAASATFPTLAASLDRDALRARDLRLGAHPRAAGGQLAHVPATSAFTRVFDALWWTPVRRRESADRAHGRSSLCARQQPQHSISAFTRVFDALSARLRTIQVCPEDKAATAVID